mmetsp:Transcript_4267/g.11877  ORF Transcript_4267/g.11877 Transcript_4267/m.11877 type:complete len:86 (+) Transcript_4267:619-876(+)
MAGCSFPCFFRQMPGMTPSAPKKKGTLQPRTIMDLFVRESFAKDVAEQAAEHHSRTLVGRDGRSPDAPSGPSLRPIQGENDTPRS